MDADVPQRPGLGRVTHPARLEYCSAMSGQLPQNYLFHTLIVSAVLVGLMVWFLMKQWG